MEFSVFNVGHGFCAGLVDDDGRVTLFDCGHSSEGFRPSIALPAMGFQRVDRLVVTNLDEDHVSDLARLRAELPIVALTKNGSVSATDLIHMKVAGIGPGISALLDMMRIYTIPYSFAPPSTVTIRIFENGFPSFTDTNNLSLACFIEYDGLSILVPGDMECAGWRTLLANPEFRAALGRVNIFVASHHGRESGCLAELFEHARPDVFIISDTDICYETQDHNYAEFASGVVVSGGDRRFVLTTRCDGSITVRKRFGQPYSVSLGDYEGGVALGSAAFPPLPTLQPRL